MAGAVLLASVPPHGLARASAELAWRDPAVWRAMGAFATRGPKDADLGALRRGLFAGAVTEEAFAAMGARMGRESMAAMMRATLGPPFAPLRRPGFPVLVAGGAEDRLVPPLDQALTALTYGCARIVAPGLGHMAMLEPGWDGLAGGIVGWARDAVAARPVTT
jgi:pimeloyl-ACP methyl ester carboxylesterase